MVIGNKKEAIIFMLHSNEISDGPEIVAQVQVACWADSTDNAFHRGQRYDFY